MTPIQIPIGGLGTVGVISDHSASTLPPSAWSQSLNALFRGDAAEGRKGAAEAFGTPSVPPFQLMFFHTFGGNFWVYCGAAAVRAMRGGSDANITRASGAYNKPSLKPWTGGFLSGIPILNNPGDAPQYWAPAGLTQPLQDLTNWPSGWRAEVVRPFGQFLVALGVNEGGGALPYSVRWSDAAPPGTLPSTWDETDLTKKAGVRELADTGGFLVESMPIRNFNVIYKQDKVYAMQFVGGSEVFGFSEMFNDFGALGPWCVASVGNEQHLVLASHVSQRGGDILIHDGNSYQSLASQRIRKWLSRAIDRGVAQNSFIVSGKEKSEAWICIPVGNATYPNRAIIWNKEYNTFSDIEIPEISHGAYGEEDVDASFTYASLEGSTYDSLMGRTYNSLSGGGGFGRLLFAQPEGPLFLEQEAAYTDLGETIPVSLERKRISIPPELDGRLLQPAYMILDMEQEGTVAPQVHIGVQENFTDSIVWWGPFNISLTARRADFVGQVPSGRGISVRVSSFSPEGRFRLKGYKLYVIDRGF